MNKNYICPKAEVKNFASEDVIATSGTTANNPLTAVATKAFNVSDANVSWKDKVN